VATAACSTVPRPGRERPGQRAWCLELRAGLRISDDRRRQAPAGYLHKHSAAGGWAGGDGVGKVVARRSARFSAIFTHQRTREHIIPGRTVPSARSCRSAPSGSPTQVTRDRYPRGDGWVAPLWRTDDVGLNRRPLRPEATKAGRSRSDRVERSGEPLTSTNALEGSAMVGRLRSTLAPGSGSRGPVGREGTTHGHQDQRRLQVLDQQQAPGRLARDPAARPA
jgi:hypothetical protein